MKGIKFIIISCWLISANFTIAQTQKLVIIEMYGYVEKIRDHSGFGIHTYEHRPFVVKTTDEYGEVTEKVYHKGKQRIPLETMPYLKKEIDLWLSKGYKLFSFNITATGETARGFRYLVLLVKEE